MVYYIVLLLIFLLFSLCCYKKGVDLKNNKYYLLASLGLLLLFLVLKHYKVCIDWLSYSKMFKLYHSSSFLELFSVGRHEIGFKLLIFFFSHIINNFYFFLMFVSIVSFIPINKYIRENSKNYFLSVLIFATFSFFSLYFTAIRFSIALSIIMLSIKYIKQHRPWNFILTVFIAGLFHKTAFVFLPVYFLYNFKLDKNKIAVIYSSYLVLFLVRGYIVNFVTKYIYSTYTPELYSNGGEKMLLLLLGIATIFVYFKDDFIKKHRVNQLYINMLLVGVYFQIFALEIGTLNRVVQYFIFPMIVLIPSFFELNKYNNKVKNIVKYSIILFFITYFCYIILFGKNFAEYYLIFS